MIHEINTKKKREKRESIVGENTVVESYVRGIARRVYQQCGKAVALEDLTAFGYTGFLQAMRGQCIGEEPDWQRRAYRRTHGAMIDGLRRWSEHGHCLSLQRRDERLNKQSNGLSLRKQDHGPPHDRGDGDREVRFGSCESASPEECVVRNRMDTRLAEAVQGLSLEDRVLIELYYHFEHSMAEVGEILGCSKGWVSRRHSRILETLHQELQEYALRRPQSERVLDSSPVPPEFCSSTPLVQSPNKGRSAKRCSGVREISTVRARLEQEAHTR